MVIPAAAWQRQVSALMGMEGPTTVGYLRTLIIAVLVGGVCVSRWRACCIDAHQDCWPGSSSGAGTCTTRWRCSSAPRSSSCWSITLINGVLYRGFLAGANRVFQPQNATTRRRHHPAAEPERSGSPTSFAPWDTLGFQGRNFVASGPARRRADPRSTARRPRSPSGCTPACRPPTPTSSAAGRPGPRTGTHPRVRSQGARHRPDHRHRVDQPGRRPGDGD